MFLTAQIKELIQKATVVSFDIFDTLLLRPFLEPADVFEALEKAEGCSGFANYRREAEPKAWEKHVSATKDDVTLDEIYQEMPENMQFMKGKEIAFEMAHLFANPEMLEVLQYALSQRKKVTITSDMYLPKPDLQKLLESQLKTNQFKLYLSSEYGMRKHTGRLFDFVLSDLKIKPSEMLHVGDNKTSDYEIPQAKGIHAVQYTKLSDAFLKDSHISLFYTTHNNYEGRTFLGILSLLRQCAQKEIGNDYWKKFAFLYGGPVVYTYVQFLIQKAKELGLTDLAFVARDGYSLKKVFDLISRDTNTKSHYTYAPRFTNLLSYLDFGPSFVQLERRNILFEFLKSQGIPITSVDDLEKFNKELVHFSQLEKAEYEKYIDSLHFGKKVGVVDSVSASFSAQKLITKSALKSEVVGLYWHYDPLTDSVLPKSAYDTNTSWPAFSDILELLMAAPESPIQRVQNCQPIYKNPIQKYEQIKIDLYPTLSEMIVKFAQLMKKLHLDIQISSQTMVDWMNSFIAGATKTDFEKFKNIQNSVDQGHTIYHSILRKTSANTPFYKTHKFLSFIYQKRVNSKGILKVKIFKIPVYVKKPKDPSLRKELNIKRDPKIFISVVRDKKMYNRLVKNNPFNQEGTFVSYDNTKENIAIPKRYNHFLDHYDYTKPAWFIFCHEDWEAKQDWLYILDSLNKNSIYGTFGTKLKIRGGNAEKLYLGQIESSHKNGDGWAFIGKIVPVGTEVETFDCMCLIVHSSLIQKHNVRFDEKLDWHHYAEELNIRLKEQYNIPSRILQMKCHHWSYGVPLPNAGFTKAFKYVKKKFAGTENYYSNTTIDKVIGPHPLRVKRVLIPRTSKLLRKLFRNKITTSSHHLVRIVGIPVYHKRLK